MENKYYIPNIEVDLTNRCNLNCARCTHFSPLAKYNFMDYPINKFEKDIKELSSKFIVGKIRLLGGEPFLLNNLLDYARITRSYFDYSNISVVSNGVLKDKIESLAPDLARYNVEIEVSGYQNHTAVDSSKVSRIKKMPRFRGISLSIEPKHDPKKSKARCVSREDFSLYDGRLYYCPIMKNLQSLEKAFNLNFNLSLEDRSIDIYLSAEEIFSALYKEENWGKLCAHCPSIWPTFPWGLSEGKISEWLDPKDIIKQEK